MKKFLCLFLALTLCFALVACGEDQPATDPAPSSGSDGTVTASQTETTDPALPSDTDTDPGEDTDTEPQVTSSEEEKPLLPEGHLVALTDQKNNIVVVVNLDADDPTADSSIVWKWHPFGKNDVDYDIRCNYRMDDAKIRVCDAWGGAVVGVTSSSGLIALMEYPSGKCLFNADASGYGPHSIEILPNGLIAVACSGNGTESKSEIRLYSALNKLDGFYIEDPINSAHGVSWDPKNNVLWALGGNEIRAYEIGGTREKPTLTVKADMGMALPGGGHDLSPVYGDTDRLWITYSGGVAQFVKSEKRLDTEYPGAALLNVKNSKSLNSFADGTVVGTVADANNKTANHDTDVLRVWKPGDEAVTELKFAKPVRDFYKARVFCVEYQ